MPPSLREIKEQELQILLAKQWKRKRAKLSSYYPDEGPLRRDLYPKHTAFFKAGAKHRERLLLAANRVGKTEGVGAYELTLHLTGLYPDWWQGRRFPKGIKAWAAGDTTQTVRDIIQAKMVGPPGIPDEHGTGLIPGDLIVETRPKAGSVPDCIETLYVKHVTGTISRFTLKTYEQGRIAFQGTEQDVIWLDEEPPLAIYTECLIRTMTVGGMVMCTFTPLEGMSETVLAFLPNGKLPGEATAVGQKFVIGATWNDAPHLSEADKRELWNSIPPHQRDARSKGIPQLGSGAIYPISEDDITVPDFEIPVFWPRGFALDVGWNWTAAAWFARDPDKHILYMTGCYKRGQAEPEVHVKAIQARGDWIPGVIDPAAQGSNQRDGSKLIDEYIGLGLDLTKAENGVEAGIFATWIRFSTGTLKIFKSCSQFFEEFRLYRRDEKGRIVKANDHVMDCCRYFVASGEAIMVTMPYEDAYADERELDWRPVYPQLGY